LLEEYVTFQVALIGSDGLVVASDRRANNLTPMAGENPGVMMNEQDKFRSNKAGPVLCFYAGGADCEAQAREIVLSFQLSDDEVKWETGLCESANRSRLPGSGLINEHIVIRKDIKGAVWLIKSQPFCFPFVSKVACLGKLTLLAYKS
jgi:hypothetical protein